MSEQATWTNSGFEDFTGTRSSQDSQGTICSQENSGFVVHGQVDENGCFSGGQEDEQPSLHLPLANSSKLFHTGTTINQSVTISSEQTGPRSMFKLDPATLINEDTQMCVVGSGGVDGNGPMESPFDTFTSPPGDVSSPFEAMESDGLNDPDESACVPIHRTKWSSGHFSTTTPRDSSDDDHYESSGSRKKRRRTKRDFHPSDNFAQSHNFSYYSHSSQIASPVCLNDTPNGTCNEQSGFLGINLQKTRGSNSQQLINNSDSSLYATIVKNKRRNSNASESNQSSICAKDNIPIMENSMASVSSFLVENDVTNTGPGESQSLQILGTDLNDTIFPKVSKLQGQFPSSAAAYSLEILVQPEDQHRARYLTEGSRGPVKDRTQQAYPQIQLKGFSGKTTLHVYVGADAEDKVRPHGFYQACKVTGRNTTSCEEIEIEGTKVIQIPFDAQQPISVDCVGILKLRNADVELRIGANRAKKRSQTVRLVFRVLLDLPGNDHRLILQVVSDRINCTQPRGQPEIVRKSLTRCSVEGNQEMFIIGKNFHRGTKVIFQDSKEPDGSHWQESGQIDKDTFNQSHLVVRIPPYHDKEISKSVNVQLYVEHDGRKCDPHSFTYDPSPAKLAQLKEAANQEKEAKKESENPLENILSTKNITRKHLEKLMALILSTDLSDSDTKQTQQESSAATQEKASISSQGINLPVASTMQQSLTSQPLFFTTDSQQLPSTVQKPVPIPVQTASHTQILAAAASRATIIRPQTFMPASQPASVGSSAVLMSTQPFKPSVNSNSGIAVTSHIATRALPSEQRLFQASTSSVFNTVSVAPAMPFIVNVKSENGTNIWPSQQSQIQGQPPIDISIQGNSGNIAIPSQSVSLVSSNGQAVIMMSSPVIQPSTSSSMNQTVDIAALQTQQQLTKPMTSIVSQMMNNSAPLQQQVTSQIPRIVPVVAERLAPIQQQQASMSGMITGGDSVTSMQQKPQMTNQISGIVTAPVQQQQLMDSGSALVTAVDGISQVQQVSNQIGIVTTIEHVPANQQQHHVTSLQQQPQSTPMQQQQATPMQQQQATPMQQQQATPMQQQQATPMQQQQATPMQQQQATPMQQQQATPMQQQQATPMQQQQATPILQQQATPILQQQATPMQQQRATTMQQQPQIASELTGMVTATNTIQSQQQNVLPGMVTPVEINQNVQSMPLERSTPVREIVKENATSFASTPQNQQWQSQVINAGPGMAFSQGQVAITTTQSTELFVTNNLGSANSFNNNSTVSSDAQPNNLINAQNNISPMTSQTSSLPGQCAMQWQPIPSQENSPAIPLSHSNSGDFVFGSHANEQTMATSQQQTLTMASAMEILDPPRPVDSNMLPSLSDALTSPPVETHSQDIIKANVFPDGNIFEDQIDLQSILSELSAPLTHSEHTPMAQDTRTTDSQPAEFAPSNSTQPSLNQGDAVTVQQQQGSTDVEMVPAQMQKPLQAEEVFINQNVDPQMFLILPNEVQSVNQQQQPQVQQHSHNASMPDVDQSHLSSNFGLPEQMQQNIHLNATSTAANVESIPSNGQFQTIDSSVLDLNTGNNNTINQSKPRLTVTAEV